MSSVHEVSGSCIKVAWVAGGYERASLVVVFFLELEFFCNLSKMIIKSLAHSIQLFGKALHFSPHLDGCIPKLLIHECWAVFVVTIRVWSGAWNGSGGLHWTTCLCLRVLISIAECLFGSDRTRGRRRFKLCGSILHRIRWDFSLIFFLNLGLYEGR